MTIYSLSTSEVCKVNSMDDPFVSLSKRGSEQFQLAIKAGGYLVDFTPWRKQFTASRISNSVMAGVKFSQIRAEMVPCAEFQTIAEYGAKVSRDMRFLPYFYARDKFVSGVIYFLKDAFKLTCFIYSFRAHQFRRSYHFRLKNVSMLAGKLSEEDEGIISAACGICYSGKLSQWCIDARMGQLDLDKIYSWSGHGELQAYVLR